jgi:hypothetical protein
MKFGVYIMTPTSHQVILWPVQLANKRGFKQKNDQSASPSWCRGPWWGFYFFITVGRLRSSCWGAPSLMRGRICNISLQFAVTLRSKSRRADGHILLSQLRLPQPGGPGPRIYIPPGTWWPSYTPGHWVPFSCPLTTRRAAGKVI